MPTTLSISSSSALQALLFKLCSSSSALQALLFKLCASALGDRHRDEARRAAALDPHQNAVLVVGARGVDRLAHIAGAGHALAGDLENHVAFLEAALGRRT